MANFKNVILAVYKLSILFTCFAFQRFRGDKCRDTSGRDGVCQIISECPIAQQNLKKGISPVTCGFEKANPIVCCAHQLPSAKLRRKPGETADYWCKEYTKQCPEVYFVVSGTPALPSEFPHMAAVGYGDQRSISWSCGGSLINEKFILTAAHCLNSGKAGPARWILLGTELLINTTLSNGERGQIHPVVRRIRHPEYKPPSKYHDVALLEIGSAVTPNALPTIGRYLHPACLPTKVWDYDQFEGLVTGWGRTGYGESGSPVLLKAKLDIFDQATCNKTYEVEIKSTTFLQKGIDSTMLCAGVLEGGTDTCQGDSGGPLQFAVKNSCMYEIWGITSFGKICAFENTPSVYMRVDEYIPWIESIVWPEEQ